jgi:hypothetical protein
MESLRAQSSATERRAHWQEVLAASQASSLSIREFCRQRGIHPSHFYHWRQRLGVGPTPSIEPSVKRKPETRFALVQAEPVPTPVPAAHDGALELVLESGWRLRIRPGVDAATLRTVLSALAPEA